MLRTLELQTYNGRNVVSTLAPSILIWSPFLHVTRTSIKVSMRSNFGPIPSLAAELAVLECLKTILLLTLWHKHFDRIFFIPVGKEDSHKKLGLQYLPD